MEYEHGIDNRYKHEILVDNEPVIFDILDTSTNHAQAAANFDPAAQNCDILLLVYSITDRKSFSKFFSCPKSEKMHRDPLITSSFSLWHMSLLLCHRSRQIPLSLNTTTRSFQLGYIRNLLRHFTQMKDLCQRNFLIIQNDYN